MGGSALKYLGIETRRASVQEYFLMVDEISQSLYDEKMIFSVVEAYCNKTSFGDMDVVICDENIVDIRDFIERNFNPKAISQNSNTYSFDYKNFQIDFILHNPRVFQTALDYYHFSPAGNAVGKIFHQFGLSYGHEGLKYIIREEHVGAENVENSHVLKEVILSDDTKTIHELIHLDHDRWLDGFDTEEEIFEWVCSSPFFNPDLYSFEAMNHRARVRDRKRPDYNRLMEWIEANKNRLPQYERQKDKSLYLPWIKDKFPKLQDELDECRELYEENQLIKSKFNGNLVREWSGITGGKELGLTIVAFKDFVGEDNFREFIVENAVDHIEFWFKTWFGK